MKTLKDARGLTLLEIVFTIGITAVGIVSILAGFNVGVVSSRTATNITTATLLGQTLLEEIRMAATQSDTLGINYNDISSTGGNWYNFGTTVKTPFPDDDRFEYETNFAQNYKNINGFHQVTLDIYWPPGAAKPRSITFVTYIRL